MDGWMDGWMDGSMDGWIDGWIDVSIDGWMDGSMDDWMDGWMDGHFYVFLQNVCPGLVATAMSGVSKTSLMSPSPESYVSSAVATIGVQNETDGCISHTILVS